MSDRANESEGSREVLPAGARNVRAGADDEIIAALQSGLRAESFRILKQEAANRTFAGEVQTPSGVRRVIVKRIRERAGGKRWIHRLFRASPAFRQWEGAMILSESGFGTSVPVAIFRGIVDGIGFEWLVLRSVDGVDALRRMHEAQRDGDSTTERRLAVSLGDLVRRLSGQGIRNRDHKLSNLIVCDDGSIAVVDTVGVSRGAGGDRRMLLAMLKEAAGVGLTLRRTTMLRVLRAAADDWKPAWRSLQTELERAGDTTPRVNPLESKP